MSFCDCRVGDKKSKSIDRYIIIVRKSRKISSNCIDRTYYGDS